MIDRNRIAHKLSPKSLKLLIADLIRLMNYIFRISDLGVV